MERCVIGSEKKRMDQTENGHALRSCGGTMSETSGVYTPQLHKKYKKSGAEALRNGLQIG